MHRVVGTRTMHGFGTDLIVPFHNDFSLTGKQSGRHKLAHTL